MFQSSFALAPNQRLDFDDPAAIPDNDDEETLAAIDEGIRDGGAGRTVSIEEVRRLLPPVDYRLLFRQRALTDLAEIIDYVASDDDEAASDFGGALLDHVDLPLRYPRMGSAIGDQSLVRKLVHSPILVYCHIPKFLTNRGSDPAGIAMETSLDKSLDPGKAASKRGVERELRSKNQTESGCVCLLANGTPSRSGSPESSRGD